VLLAGLIVVLFIFSGEVIKCIADRHADAAAGRRTVATCLPVRTVTWIYAVIAVASLGAAVAPWGLGAAPGRYLAAMLPAALIPISGAVVVLLLTPGDRALEFSLRVVKAVWYAGLLAMTLLR